ncbi:hypothetical protein Bca4012_068441 [Brassica carinata]
MFVLRTVLFALFIPIFPFRLILNLLMACQAVSNIVKTSLGPVGLDKMLVDDIGDVTITNDGATILRMLEVEHPAAKVLVELAVLQDREVGDGTTSVVIVAAELLKRANDLVRNKIHPTSIISGYRLAMREACKYIEEKLVTKVEKLGKVPLINCAKTSMSSKLISGDSDFFANLVVDAVLSVKMTNQRGEIKYPIKGINILKAHGQSARDSYLLNGYALNTGRAAQGMPLRVSPAKIACLDFNLQKTKMQLGVQMGGDPGISAFPEEDNIFCWKGTITGSDDTVFQGTEYRLSLAFSNDYPFKPPKVKFETCCFHPNVDLYGNICLDILQDKWSSAYDVRTILLSIQSLLGEPNISSPLNNQAAHLWSNQEGDLQ